MVGVGGRRPLPAEPQEPIKPKAPERKAIREAGQFLGAFFQSSDVGHVALIEGRDKVVVGVDWREKLPAVLN